MARRPPSAGADRLAQAERIFRRRGGVLRTMEAVRHGVHPRTLYEMRDAGTLEQLGRGLYRLADLPPLDQPDLVAVALRVRAGVFCLASALAFHEMTDAVPDEIQVALERGTEPPRLDRPPIRTFSFGSRAYNEGIESHRIDGVTIRVYSPAKTVADCFKFRTKLGLETALDALKVYLHDRGGDRDALMRFARVCRVATIVRPYVEALP